MFSHAIYLVSNSCITCVDVLVGCKLVQEGASKEEIDQLPKFKFKSAGNSEKDNSDVQRSHSGFMTECGNKDTPSERYLSHEDAVCNLIPSSISFRDHSFNGNALRINLLSRLDHVFFSMRKKVPEIA